MRKRTRLLVLGLIGAFLAVAVVAYFSPFDAVTELGEAIDSGDPEALTELVDFDTLRENMKRQFADKLVRRVDRRTGETARGFQLFLGMNMINAAIESWITPAGLKNASLGRTSKADRSFNSQPSNPTSEPFYRAKVSYDSLGRFSARVPGFYGEPVRFVFSRSGFSWKLTNIIFPDSFFR